MLEPLGGSDAGSGRGWVHVPDGRPSWRDRIEGAHSALRMRRRVISLGAIVVATGIAYAAAYAVAFGLTWNTSYHGTIGGSIGVLVGIRVAAAWAFGLSTHRWRFVGPKEVRRLVAAVAAGSVLFLGYAWLADFDPRIPRSVIVIEPLFTLAFTTGLWLGYRTAFEILWRRGDGPGPTRRIVVVGAGEAGEALVRQTTLQPTSYRAVAFVDDDPHRHGASIHGVRVYGGTDQLERVVRRTRADEVVIAIPSADPADLRRIVERCEPAEIPFRVLPGISEVLEGKISLAQLREVRIEDLLGREPVDIALPELGRDIGGETVLITGAAGSIGSELARQCVQNRPGRLVLLDQSETGLFYLERELRELEPDVPIVPTVADVVDATGVDRIVRRHRPSRVFHAAAYKHVPMMESNVREAIRNNAVGTWRVAEAAGRHGSEKFVLVSTDKAVRPANVMGATKRVAEIVVLELQDRYPDTAYGAVRFGNVLGSAGSVIPVFKKQLENGRPLTVTDPGATRYFMTIPEAAQLVLQASLLPDLRGRVAMLDMGEPVRILDLARTLIRLAGGKESREAIVFTGLRPGEKLHEELVAPGERTSTTDVPKIGILHPNGVEPGRVLGRMERWDELLAAWRIGPVLEELRAAVPEVAGGIPARWDGDEVLEGSGAEEAEPAALPAEAGARSTQTRRRREPDGWTGSRSRPRSPGLGVPGPASMGGTGDA